MDEPTLPAQLVEARRTPLFDFATLPDALANSHRTTVWAEIRVAVGTVRFVELEGDEPRDERLDSGESAVIVPGIEHHVEASTDAQFYVQFFREPDAAMVPGVAHVDSLNRAGPWTPRNRDLDTDQEIVEMVTRQYVDVLQDDCLAPYFNFGPEYMDWQAHIRSVADYWCHVLLYAPGYEIDVIESHRHLHDHAAFTPEVFDRWLQIFLDTVNGGWHGPLATTANKRATGMAWAMAHRFLGHGVWRPADRL
ncbi:MAG: DUF1971 domain-containing protein [Ilumatobacteraceae bacterium]